MNRSGKIRRELRGRFDRQLLRALQPLTGGLALVFSLLFVLHLLDPSVRPAVLPIAAAHAGSAALFLLFSGALSRGRVPASWAHPVGLIVAFVALANAQIAFLSTEDPVYLSYLTILIMGCGALMLSWSYLAASIGLTCAISAALAWGIVPPLDFYHYGLAVVVASALAVIIFTARLRALVRTEGALVAAVEEGARRRRAEQALRGGEERMELAIAGSQGGWWDIQLDPRNPEDSPDEIRIDPMVKAFIGFEDHEFPNSVRAWRERILPEDLERHAAAASDHLTGKTALYEIEYRVRHRDGDVRWIYSRGRTQRNADGIPIRFSGIVWDVTDSKHAEDRLHLLTRAVEQSSSLVIITDTEGAIEYTNPKFTLVTGYSFDEVVGKQPSLLKSSASSSETERELWETIRAGREWHGEFSNVKKDGTPYWVISSVSPIKNADGVTQHYLAVQEDITARKRVEARLAQSQKMESVGQLVSGVAHDFNNLLTAVIGFADLALERADAEDPVFADLLEIRKAGESAGLLTAQLLAFSRQQVLRPRVLCLNDVLTGIEELLRRTISEDIELELHLDPTLGKVKVDPTQMKQILINLATNARDAMRGGGRLTIETSNRELDSDDVGGNVNGFAGSFIQLAVSDEGCGMDAATSKQIFEPFFTTKAPGSGTGLGLSTVYGTVKQSGGFVWVYSEPGRGSTFKIYLPRVKEASHSDSVESVVASELKGTETILLVEDHEGVRRIAAAILERNGYRAIETKNPVQAIEVARNTNIDLLLSDIVMPGMNGVSLAEQIRKLHPEARLVFMSGYSQTAARKSFEMDPTTRFLSKPFRSDELLSSVRGALEGTP